MQTALLPAALLSQELEILTVNKPLCDLVRLTAAQLRRRTLLDIIDESDRHGFESFAGEIAAQGRREVRLAPGSESERKKVLIVMKRAEGGGAAGFLMNLVDLTDTTSDAERSALLEDAALDWRRTFDAVEMPIMILGTGLSVVRINQAARMLAGKSHGEISGSSLRDLPAAEPWRSIAVISERVQKDRAPQAYQVKDSAGRTLDLLAMLFRAEDPADERVIVIVWDVSALVDLQARVEQQRQMATMGALVAGVAHEVRNPLFAISATIDAMEQTAAPELREYFEVLREEIDRMTTLMQDLLAYGRPTKPVFADVRVKDVIEAAARACSAAAAKPQIEVVVDAGEDAFVVADRDRLGRAIENLILNAIQHAPAQSKVVVRCVCDGTGKRRVVRIMVRDSGHGFPADDLTRIFEPFFSRRKGGTGLGLALVHQIVTEHGGEVTATNAPEGGAEVVITIPARI